jgi:hypothetical protein
MLKILLVLSPKICCAMQHNGAPAPGPALIAYQTPGMICEHTRCERTDTCVHSFGCIALCAEHGPGQCVGTSEQDNCPVCEPEAEPEPEPTPEQQPDPEPESQPTAPAPAPESQQTCAPPAEQEQEPAQAPARRHHPTLSLPAQCEECDLPGIHGMYRQPDGSCEYYYCEEHYIVVGTCFGCGISLHADWALERYPNADGVTFRDYCRPCGRHGDPHAEYAPISDDSDDSEPAPAPAPAPAGNQEPAPAPAPAPAEPEVTPYEQRLDAHATGFSERNFTRIFAR